MEFVEVVRKNLCRVKSLRCPPVSTTIAKDLVVMQHHEFKNYMSYDLIVKLVLEVKSKGPGYRNVHETDFLNINFRRILFVNKGYKIE